MLTFLLCDRHRHTVENFFETWREPGDLDGRVLAYESLALDGEVGGGAVVFTDHERLIGAERLYGRWLAWRVGRFPGRFRILNHPARVLDRFTLARRLHELGRNDFAVHRIGAARSKAVRYPVFLRYDNDHRGAQGTRLLRSPHEVERALARTDRFPLAKRERLMLVEYLDVGDADGLFRKYSIQKIGDALIPRHVLVSKHWVQKKPDIVTGETAAVEQAYMDDFPFRSEIEETFRIAGVDYGRIDYGVHRGRMQVWEINTNPVIALRREEVHALRLPQQIRSVRWMFDAFRELSASRPPDGARPFQTRTSVAWSRLRRDMQARSPTRR